MSSTERDAVGETADMVMFDGDAVGYVAQVPSKHSMRIAQLPVPDVRALPARTGLTAQTPPPLLHSAAAAAPAAELSGRPVSST